MSNMARMDDLISRKSLLEKTHMADVLHANKGITKSVEVVLADDVEVAPSAFEGMTVGEALKAVFPNAVIRTDDSRLIVEVLFSNEVWNAPYKAESEANKTYQEQCKGDTTWGSSTRALKR